MPGAEAWGRRRAARFRRRSEAVPGDGWSYRTDPSGSSPGSALEESFPALRGWTPGVLFPSRADPQVAQIILGGIAASIMTVVSIVFAIMLMTLTLASMQFSPRIIVSFVQDRVTQWTLGIFLGTFLYC